MTPKRIMLIAGEPSGDVLAAELVSALRRRWADPQAGTSEEVQPLHTGLEPQFFGAGGPAMAAQGVKLDLDLTAHAVFGLSEVLKKLGQFRAFFRQLLHVAQARQPDVIVFIDYGGFNLRFARAVRELAARQEGPFVNWRPKLVYFVPPQVWASRSGRARWMAQSLDLVISILPFEKAWYAQHQPTLRVEFVGHPMVERFGLRQAENDAVSADASGIAAMGKSAATPAGSVATEPLVVLLPGSRLQEIRRHFPVMVEAAKRMQRARRIRFVVVLPNEAIMAEAKCWTDPELNLQLEIGGLRQQLAKADLAIASSGTVTLECACFRVPTVVLYRLSWATYAVARQVVKVKYIAMPNLLADAMIFPEFIQHQATPEPIAEAGLRFLSDAALRSDTQRKLSQVVSRLGQPGAADRAADAVVRLLGESAAP